jgi:hypothetical protein|tara:strand:- start:439 stop:585 length:147 start_codon:yes stop_codon:yes gene_type:complete
MPNALTLKIISRYFNSSQNKGCHIYWFENSSAKYLVNTVALNIGSRNE